MMNFEEQLEAEREISNSWNSDLNRARERHMRVTRGRRAGDSKRLIQIEASVEMPNRRAVGQSYGIL
jgi:hypothetical protein